MQRIQRKRTRGWRLPANAVYIGRPSRWGNPYAINHRTMTRSQSLLLYREYMQRMRREYPARYRALLEPLRGKDLCCWCAESEPCHGDVLLRLAAELDA